MSGNQRPFFLTRLPSSTGRSHKKDFRVNEAILRAGGFDDFANCPDVKVTCKPAHEQGNKQPLMVNVGKDYDKDRVEIDEDLRPSDFIFVPKRTVRF